MEVFTFSCIDPITNMEMIIKDTTYNRACFWLESKLGSKNFVKAESIGSNLIKLVWKQRTFVFDEKRGLLLGE